jgi:toxin FitB
MIGIASTPTGTGLNETLVDTDVLIDHFRGHRVLDLTNPFLKISTVTRCELFAGRNADEAHLRQILDFLDEVIVDRAIAERGGQIRRACGIAIADALIAATALSHELELMTRNVRHFERVQGLRLQATPEA